MSIRSEQYWSLKMTRELMSDIISQDNYPKKKEMKHRVHMCLKHFPFLDDEGKPMFSQY